ncbi:MAG TPA: preprotein translocase subunit YajC [Clostridiaceae bacterium]|nr:preprotein translocase subunit YajC [Clostridiaceae bacterium]
MGEIGITIGYLLFFAVLMYLMIFLPQKRREKKMKQMLDSMQVGNKVVTIGGITGKVINIKDDEVTIETSVEKTKMNLKKWAIKEVEKPIEA